MDQLTEYIDHSKQCEFTSNLAWRPLHAKWLNYARVWATGNKGNDRHDSGYPLPPPPANGVWNERAP